MGRNKALLPLGKTTLAQRVAEELRKVANPVCLVGDPGVYGALGWPVIGDGVADRGPLSGIEAALLSPYASEWNLIAACDLPRVDAGVFRMLAEEAARAEPETDCVVPGSPLGKLEPLCAVYRRRCGEVARDALTGGTRRVVDVVAMLQAKFWPVHDTSYFQNVNTAAEWNRFLNDR